MNSTDRRFFGGLEVLRGIAASMVVLFHCSWENHLCQTRIIRNSYLMVDLFFVLSGFVICHNYFKKLSTGRGLREFIFLRLGRIYPLHFVVLCLFLGLEVAKYAGETRYGFTPHQSHAFATNNGGAFILNLLLAHPFFPFANSSFNTPSWSIGVEFYTYLVFGVAAVLVRTRVGLFVTSLALVLGSQLLLGWSPEPGFNASAGFSFFRCLLGFFTGVLVYQLYETLPKRFSPWGVKLVPLLLATLAVFLACKANPKWDYLVTPIFALMVLAVASASDSDNLVERVSNARPLRWLGRVSYSVYMIHLLVLILMARVVEILHRHVLPPAASGVAVAVFNLAFLMLAIALVLFLSHFTHQHVEMFWRKKFRVAAVKLAGAPEPGL